MGRVFFLLLSPVGLWVLVRGAVCAATYVAENPRKKKDVACVTVHSWGELIVPCFSRLREGPRRAERQKTATKTTTTAKKKKVTAMWCVIITAMCFTRSNGMKTLRFFPPATSRCPREK